MLQPTTFKEATLYIPKKESATWFVIWYNYNPGTKKLERIRKTFDLNRIADITERKAIGQTYCTLINRALRNGANAFTASTVANDYIGSIKLPAPKIVPTIQQSLRSALNKHCLRLKKRSADSYESAVNRFVAWLTSKELHTLPINEISDEHIQDYVEHRIGEGLSNTTVNTQVSFLNTLFAVMIKKLKLIKVNPVAGYDALPETETDYFQPFTQDELTRIADHLQTRDPQFALFTKFIYWAAIRPGHLPMYKGRQIDYANGLITTYGTTTKNRKNTSKQLMRPLQQALIAMGRHIAPAEWYLFTNNFEPGPEYSPTLNRKAIHLWHKYVHRELGIHKKMYALKHTAGQFYLDNNDNVDTGWLQRQMEHHSLQQTELYVRKRKTKKLKEGNGNLPRY